MKTSTFIKQSILFIAIGLATAVTTAQTILTVDNNTGSTAAYTDLQTAHDAAAAGDIIYVQASSTSYGTLAITKAISIVGRSHSESNKVSTLSSIGIASSDVIIKGLNVSSISSTSAGTVPYENIEIYESKISTLSFGQYSNQATDNLLVQGNQISSFSQYQYATNVLVVNNIFTFQFPLTIYDPVSIVVANNIFRYDNGMYLYNYGVGVVNISNNMFIKNFGNNEGVYFYQGAFQLSNNLFYNYNTAFSQNLVGGSGGSYSETNSLFDTDPQFTSVDVNNSASMAGTSTLNFASNSDDLTLQAGSPALTGGSGGSEIGIFNNGFNYKYYGNPRAIPALDITSYDATVPKNSTINVTITAKAH